MKLSILAMLLVFTISAKAQVNYGIKLGAIGSTLVTKEKDDFKPSFGSDGGLFVNFPVLKDLSLQPELLISTEGASIKGGGNFNLNFVNIPLMLRFKRTKFFIEAGPQVGLLLSAKVKFEGEEDLDVKDDIKSTNLALNLGLGYEFEKGLGISLRESFGLTSLNKENENSIRSFNISVGLYYRFGNKNNSK